MQLEAQRLARERDLAERERDLEQQLNTLKVEMGGGAFGPGGGMSLGARGVMLPLPPGMVPQQQRQRAPGSFEFGVSPREQTRAGAGTMMMMNAPGLDSHRSFAGALDGVGGGGDALDGFVVHSRFVRADAPIGEGEGGGLVPPVGSPGRRGRGRE